jgi:hypothetical protein
MIRLQVRCSFGRAGHKYHYEDKMTLKAVMNTTESSCLMLTIAAANKLQMCNVRCINIGLLRGVMHAWTNPRRPGSMDSREVLEVERLQWQY